MNNVTRNWRTSLLGLLALAASLAPVWAPEKIAIKIQQSAGVLSGLGLVAAKDSDKSGTATGA